MRYFKRNWRLALINKALAASLIVATGVSLPPSTSAQTRLPALGEGGDITVAEERQLGDMIARDIYRDPSYVDDPPLAEYVQGIWDELLAAARKLGELTPEIDAPFAWEVLLIRDRTVNAFALPGGYMGVQFGLIGVVTSRDELASVLAHETSHITQRHISRLITQQGQQTPLVIAAMVLGALAASRSPDATQALVLGGQALAVQNQLNFSRDMEREADRMGYTLMQPAGFAPQGFVSMFDKLQQANRLNDNGAWPYLRTHPLTTERIADMQARLQSAGLAFFVPPPTTEHAMLSARARVLANPGVDALRQRVAEPKNPGFATLPLARRAAALYATALASSQLRDFDGARASARQLADAVRSDAGALRQAQLLATEIELAAGDAQAALQRLPAKERSPHPRPEMLLRAQALLRSGRAADAAEVAETLQTWVTTHARDATAWQLLASAWQVQGQALRAIRAEAESFVAHYDYAAAVDRLKAAQNLARKGGANVDYIEASIIDARLRAVQLLAKEQAAQR
jgi:predicted Zn-dependent protease